MDTYDLSFLRVNFLGAWLAASSLTLIFAFFFLIYTFQTKTIFLKTNTYKLYQALPQTQAEIEDQVTHQDGRSKVVEAFFAGYKSKLAIYSETFIQVADKYHLDYRLLPAIAMQESNGGRKTPKDSYNPFGFGIYGSTLVKFSSWEEGIETVGKAIRENYLNQGLHTPEQIMAKYTPPSLAKGGPWAKGVSQFMEELR